MTQRSAPPTVSMRQLLDSMDWSETPLGPRETWNESLKTAVNLMMDSHFPMFIAWGPERIFLYNDAYIPVLGKKHPMAFGMRFEHLWSEIWQDLLPLIRSVDQGQPVYLENMQLIMNRNGYDEETYFTFSYSPVRDASNAVCGLYCACVETTKRIQSERALQASQESLVDTLESMSDGFFTLDKNWKITSVNENMVKILKLSRDQMIGKDPRHLWLSAPEFKATQYWIQYHRVMEQRVQSSFVEYYEPLQLWTQVKAFPKSDGGMAIFFSDISEVKRAEEALAIERQKVEAQLKKDKNRLLSILENVPGPVALVTGPDLVFEYTNSKYREMFFEGRDHVGKRVIEVLPEAIEQGFVDLLKRVLKTGVAAKGTETPFHIRQADGSIKHFYLNFVYEPVRDNEQNVESILCGIFDVTELVESKKSIEASEQRYRIAKEQAESANISKTAFLANMSHEIRTPMTAVLGFADVLRESDLSEEERQDALGRIDRSGRSLLKLIDDILDISKVESGKLSIEKMHFSPLELVTEVVSMLRLQAEQKGLILRSQFSSSVPTVASSDPARVRQILTNLIGNAVKFTSKGEIKIDVDVERTEKGNYLVFNVSDTGIGISAQDHQKLFQPFAQADESISRQFGGTGLGLVLSKRLAEQLGGDLILAASKVGEGSLFVVKVEAGPWAYQSLQGSVTEAARKFPQH